MRTDGYVHVPWCDEYVLTDWRSLYSSLHKLNHSKRPIFLSDVLKEFGLDTTSEVIEDKVICEDKQHYLNVLQEFSPEEHESMYELKIVYDPRLV